PVKKNSEPVLKPCDGAIVKYQPPFVEHDSTSEDSLEMDLTSDEVKNLSDDMDLICGSPLRENFDPLVFHDISDNVKGSILTPYKAGGPFLSLVEPEAASLPLVGVGLSTSQPPPSTVEDDVTNDLWLFFISRQMFVQFLDHLHETKTLTLFLLNGECKLGTEYV
ncbi:hypothetical protein Tco_0027039, partial [Tanacetum coccineum]